MLYTESDIELLKSKSDAIREKLELIKQTNSEPSQEDLKKAQVYLNWLIDETNTTISERKGL